MASCLTLKKSNCKNCYKCIRHCPVKSIRFSGNQAHIIGDECILCGHCFVVCPQNAKEIVDDTEKVKVLIQSGDPVYVSLAPSFIANYEGVGIEKMRAALKKLGFADVEETAVGATMVKREYERILKEEQRGNTLLFTFAQSVDEALCPENCLQLAIALDDGSLYAFDASRYDPATPELRWELDEAAAGEAVPSELEVQAVRRMVLRSAGGRDLPCYVFSCAAPGGRAVEIAVSAETGKQVRIALG